MNLNKLRHPSWIAVVAALVAVIAAAHTAGVHESHERTQVAFIDFPLIMRESDVGKSLNSQVVPKKQALQEEAQAKLKFFQKQEDDIRANRFSAKPAEIEAQFRALQQKVNEWNEAVQKGQNELDNAVSEAVVQIKQVLQEQLALIADKEHVSAILPSELAFFRQKQLDLTPEAIRLLNEKLPAIDLKLEAPKDDKAKESQEEKDKKSAEPETDKKEE